MTEIGRTNALNALLGQILNPRGGSFADTSMKMDKHGWMDLEVQPKRPRPTDYLGSDTGAAMDILKAVADERMAMAGPPAPAPAAAGPGMRGGGLVGRRGYAVGGLVSPLPATQGATGTFTPQPAAGAFSSSIGTSAPRSVIPASAISGALDATAPQLPPLTDPTPATSTGAFSGAFAGPQMGAVAPRVGGTATAGGGVSTGALSTAPLGLTPPAGPLATQAGMQAGALVPQVPQAQRFIKGATATGAMADGGMVDGADEEEGGEEDPMKGIGMMLMSSGTQLMADSRKADGGVVEAAMAATGAKMGALGGGPSLAPGDVYSPGDMGAMAEDELPIGKGIPATSATQGIFGAGYQPTAAVAGERPTLQFVGGKAGGGMVHGPGDGRSDSIPVDLAGAPGAIADGEYVMPAYAVSALGEGSSAAGARKLDALVGDLKTSWPKKIKGFGKPKAGGKPLKRNGGAFAEGGAKTPGYVQRSQKNIFKRLEKLQDERPYEADVAALNADQQQAFKQARGVATGDSTGYFSAVQGGQDMLSGVFDGDGSNKAYDDELVQASLEDFDRGARIASADADRKAAGRGAFGSRRGISEGAQAETNMRNRALLGSQLREQGLERRTAAAGQIAKLAGDERNAAIGNVALLTGVGNQVQEHDQAILDAGMNRLKTQSAIVAGTPYSGGAAGGNKMQGALGGAMAGAGAGAMTGNPYAIAGGAVIGGAAGYFGSKDGGVARRRGRRSRRQQRGAFAEGGNVEKPSGAYREATLRGRRSKNVIDQRRPAATEADRLATELFRKGVNATHKEIDPSFIDRLLQEQRDIDLGPLTDLSGRVLPRSDAGSAEKLKELKTRIAAYPGGTKAFWRDQARKNDLHYDAVRETQNLPPLIQPEPMVKPGEIDGGAFAEGGAVVGADDDPSWYEPGYVGRKLGLPTITDMLTPFGTEKPSLKESARPPEVPGDLEQEDWGPLGGMRTPSDPDNGSGLPSQRERRAMRSPPMLDFIKPKGGAAAAPAPAEPAAGGALVPIPRSKPAVGGALVKKAGTKNGKRVANDGFVGPKPSAGGAMGMPAQLTSAEPTATTAKVNPNDQDAWLKLKALLDGKTDASVDETAAIPTDEDKATMDYGPVWAKPLMAAGFALMAAKGGSLSQNIGEAGLVGVNAFNQELGQRRQDARLDIAEKRQASLDAAAGRKAQMDLEKTIYDMQQDALKLEIDQEKLDIDRTNAADLRAHREAQLGVSRANAATAAANAATTRDYRHERLKQIERQLGMKGAGTGRGTSSDAKMVDRYNEAIVKAEAEGMDDVALRLRQSLGNFQRSIGGAPAGGGDDEGIPPPPDGAEIDDLEE